MVPIQTRHTYYLILKISREVKNYNGRLPFCIKSVTVTVDLEETQYSSGSSAAVNICEHAKPNAKALQAIWQCHHQQCHHQQCQAPALLIPKLCLNEFLALVLAMVLELVLTMLVPPAAAAVVAALASAFSVARALLVASCRDSCLRHNELLFRTNISLPSCGDHS